MTAASEALLARLETGRPLVMGVLNLTPDSFSDGGDFLAPADAVAQARRLVADGADLLDLGAESTRPGAAPVGEAEEWDRLAPVLEAVVPLGVPVSVDTRKPAVMRAAAAAGAALLNDVTALSHAADSLETAAATGLPVVLMHMRGTPDTMNALARYEDVVAAVREELGERLAAAEAAGIPRRRILLDPGLGFAKDAGHNVEILHRLPELAALGRPLLVGASRKRFIGRLTGIADARARDPGSLGAALYAVRRGAAIVRVHDVAATRQALDVWLALEQGSLPDGGA